MALTLPSLPLGRHGWKSTARGGGGASLGSFGLRRKQVRFVVRAPRCMSVDVDSEQDHVNSQLPNDDLILNPRKGLEERFAVLNTGKNECRSCGHIYDEALGDMLYPVAAGTSFQQLPDDWRCPTCGAAKSYFSNKSVEVAGFAQNQQYGLGGNSLTSGQKSILIYGTLAFFFALFLSGYFLQ